MKESKHVKGFKLNHIKDGETVLAFCDGYIGEMGSAKNKQYNGSLVVTQERVCFYRKGLLGEVLETMPIKSITSIERMSMMGHRVIRMHTSNDSLDFKTFDKQGDKLLYDTIEEGRTVQQNQVEPQQAQDDPFSKLKKLTELKEMGAITNEEFEEKKAVLMSQI